MAFSSLHHHNSSFQLVSINFFSSGTESGSMSTLPSKKITSGTDPDRVMAVWASSSSTLVSAPPEVRNRMVESPLSKDLPFVMGPMVIVPGNK